MFRCRQGIQPTYVSQPTMVLFYEVSGWHGHVCSSCVAINSIVNDPGCVWSTFFFSQKTEIIGDFRLPSTAEQQQRTLFCCIVCTSVTARMSPSDRTKDDKKKNIDVVFYNTRTNTENGPSSPLSLRQEEFRATSM